MTELELFNIALGEHGKTITQQDIDNEIWEVRLCRNNFRASVLNVLGEYDWNFLITKVIIDYGYDFPEGNWEHGFLLPQGILRVIPRSTQPYEIMRNKFLTNECRPEIYAIMDTLDIENTRDDLCYLIAYNMAFNMCSNLSPNNQNIMSAILQKYNIMFQTMVGAQSNSYIRSVEEGGVVDSSPIPEFRPNRSVYRIENPIHGYSYETPDDSDFNRRFELDED